MEGIPSPDGSICLSSSEAAWLTGTSGNPLSLAKCRNFMIRNILNQRQNLLRKAEGLALLLRISVTACCKFLFFEEIRQDLRQAIYKYSQNRWSLIQAIHLLK